MTGVQTCALPILADNDQIKQSKKEALYKRQRELAREGLLVGVEKERLIEAIHHIYDKEGNDR